MISVKIYIDTNAIYSTALDFAVNKGFTSAIEEVNEDLNIHAAWFIPEIVHLETKYQKFTKVLEKWNSFKRISEFIGGQNFTEEQLKDVLEQKLKEQREALGLELILLDREQVSLDDLIDRNVNRIPPFENKDKSEKGTRDYLIGINILQHVGPHKEEGTFDIFVCNDNILKEFIEGQDPDIIIVPDHEALMARLSAMNQEGVNELISILADEIDATFFHYEEDEHRNANRTGLYLSPLVKEEIDKILEQELARSPFGYDKGTTYASAIQAPQYDRHEGNIYYWNSRIKFDSSATRSTLYRLGGSTNLGSLGSLGSDQNQLLLGETGISVNTMLNTIYGTIDLVATWRCTIENNQISNPELDHIELVKSNWKDPFKDIYGGLTGSLGTSSIIT